eukprot:6344178-Pyramimonas_sp.AAC.1
MLPAFPLLRSNGVAMCWCGCKPSSVSIESTPYPSHTKALTSDASEKGNVPPKVRRSKVGQQA